MSWDGHKDITIHTKTTYVVGSVEYPTMEEAVFEARRVRLAKLLHEFFCNKPVSKGLVEYLVVNRDDVIEALQ